jgi:hypothetical protein
LIEISYAGLPASMGELSAAATGLAVSNARVRCIASASPNPLFS